MERLIYFPAKIIYLTTAIVEKSFMSYIKFQRGAVLGCRNPDDLGSYRNCTCAGVTGFNKETEIVYAFLQCRGWRSLPP
jgi:hypothetical protein